MTDREKALHLIETGNFPDLFELLKEKVGERADITRLKEMYIGKYEDQDFHKRLRILVNEIWKEPKPASPARSRLAYAGVALVLCLLIWAVYAGKTNNQDKTETKQETKATPKPQNFHVIILPFFHLCKYKGLDYDAGMAIKIHLEHIIDNEHLAITVDYLDMEEKNVKNINSQKAEELRQTNKADMVIFGVYQTSACSAKGDQVCLNYLTDSKWGLGNVGKNLDKERFAQGGYEELKAGKVQEKVENIALFVSVLAQARNIDHAKYLKKLQDFLDKPMNNKLKAYIFFELGKEMTREGKYESAYLHYQKALAVCEQENDLEGMGILSIMIGDYLLTVGRTEEVLKYYKQSLGSFEKLYEADTTRAYNKRNVAIAHYKIGDIYEKLGKYHEALPYKQKNLALIQALHLAYPKDVDFKAGLALSYQDIGNLYQQSKQLEKALPYFERDLQIKKELQASYPDNIHFQHLLSASYGFVGEIYDDLGLCNMELVQGYFEQAVQLSEVVCQKDTQNVKYKNGLGLNYNALGVYYTMCKTNKKQARKYYQKALKIFQELVKNSPESVEFKENLKMVEENLERVE